MAGNSESDSDSDRQHFERVNFNKGYYASVKETDPIYQTTENIQSVPSKMSMWVERWLCSSNAKDIGVLYLMFALFSGLIGTAFSVLIRLELSAPGVQYIADNQLYNSIITAHAIVMIFFMVKKWRLFNQNFQTTCYICNNKSNKWPR